jgi:hypothetical protein
MDGLSHMIGNDQGGNVTSVRRQSLFFSPTSNKGGAGGGSAFDDRKNQHHENGEGFFSWGGEGMGGGATGNKNGDGAGRASSDDIFATAAAMREKEINKQLTGHGYNLSFVHHKNRTAYDKPYFFASPVGAPFPSYHSNPMPNFPARWTQIPGVRPPCETLIAPRIRLAPKELTAERRTDMDRMRYTANEEYERNRKGKLDIDGKESHEGTNVEIEALNLSFQGLGDPYQYEAFVTFMDLNRNVRILNLNDNELEDITDLHLDTVVRLHLSRNNFVSFEGVPPLKNCEELFLSENFLSSFRGLNASNFPKLRVLNADHNPIAMTSDYREALKDAIPTLQYVDGLKV